MNALFPIRGLSQGRVGIWGGLYCLWCYRESIIYDLFLYEVKIHSLVVCVALCCLMFPWVPRHKAFSFFFRERTLHWHEIKCASADEIKSSSLLFLKVRFWRQRRTNGLFITKETRKPNPRVQKRVSHTSVGVIALHSHVSLRHSQVEVVEDLQFAVGPAHVSAPDCRSLQSCGWRSLRVSLHVLPFQLEKRETLCWVMTHREGFVFVQRRAD